MSEILPVEKVETVEKVEKIEVKKEIDDDIIILKEALEEVTPDNIYSKLEKLTKIINRIGIILGSPYNKFKDLSTKKKVTIIASIITAGGIFSGIIALLGTLITKYIKKDENDKINVIKKRNILIKTQHARSGFLGSKENVHLLNNGAEPNYYINYSRNRKNNIINRKNIINNML